MYSQLSNQDLRRDAAYCFFSSAPWSEASVNEAARITAAAKGGEILVSNVVRELAKGKDFLFADRGEANLKGFDEPVRLYEVRWREEGGGAR